MNWQVRWLICCAGVLGVVWLAGCGQSETTDSQPDGEHHDHDHGHEDASHAESLADAMSDIERLRDAIQKAFADGDAAKADGQVHEIGHLLEELPDVAAKESLSEEQKQQVKQSVDSLMDSFGAIDERVHGGDEKGKSYDEVAAEIDQALADLKSVIKQEPAE